ncbi:diuretic hormone receptor [Caerostris darwini]|uniref:Diuretic hormone receptor n=1 Tax=Caerostris darwini TaxID=1538125 RepID=A0AAV4N351_9ARAC|nr:diuretic hormone receptor [Caerostris darwini]
MVTYLLIDLTWIITATLQSNPNPTFAKVACFLVILLTYLMATNFFWMFVEGLYLYMLVVKTFSIDKIQFRTYVCIGWGIPAIVAAAWAIVKGTAGGVSEEPLAQRGCPWQNKDYYDYVFSCPVMLVLVINIFFLAKIMWVLITKLRASNTVESKQYRKAAKALLVLIPLLGVTYIVVIATPSEPVAEVVFIYIQATLLSIQGFVVAVLYCFLNGEVQNSLRHHLERWRTQKTVGKTPRHSVGHLSPHHGESIALYRDRDRGARESCTSFTTTTSVVNLPKRKLKPMEFNNLPRSELKPVKFNNLPRSELKPVKFNNLPRSELKPVKFNNLPRSELKPVKFNNLPRSELKPRKITS